MGNRAAARIYYTSKSQTYALRCADVEPGVNNWARQISSSNRPKRMKKSMGCSCPTGRAANTISILS